MSLEPRGSRESGKTVGRTEQGSVGEVRIGQHQEQGDNQW